jgi:hypothetical protein
VGLSYLELNRFSRKKSRILDFFTPAQVGHVVARGT